MLHLFLFLVVSKMRLPNNNAQNEIFYSRSFASKNLSTEQLVVDVIGESLERQKPYISGPPPSPPFLSFICVFFPPLPSSIFFFLGRDN